VLKDLGRVGEATAAFAQALRLLPNEPSIYNNLGALTEQQGGLDAAEGCYRHAIALKPDYAEAYNNLGNVLVQKGDLASAESLYREAARLWPDYAEAHNNLAIALLAQGKMEEGWREHEWRWRTPVQRKGKRDFPQPQWGGEAAAGRVLLIHGEQGFGDSIQFCRYAPLAAARGLRVILEVPKPLVRLMKTLAGVEQVVTRGEALPPFDFQCPILSLPLALGPRLEDIPHPLGYLAADPSLVEVWRGRLAPLAENKRKKVGLVWAGNPALGVVDRRRSIPPELLLPLFNLPEVQIFSLQKDKVAAPPGIALPDIMGEVTDFADTAALIANLDLVISVDTAIVHLAAALGKPVWLLNRFDSCWRWLRARDDSPWYPTLRQFRQTEAGDWAGVVARVKTALSQGE